MQERIFKKFFDVAEIGNLSKEEYAKYFESEKIYYDNDGAIRTAEAKGRAEGLAEGLEKGLAEGIEEGQHKEKAETVRRLSQMGLTLEQIAQGTNLTIEEVTVITQHPHHEDKNLQ